MKLFKNKVGRPSKKDIRNRRIACALEVCAVLCIVLLLVVFVNKVFTKGAFNTENKNASSVSISFASYNTSPKVGTTIKFSHTVKNAKNKYQRWFVYKNGNQLSSGKCQKLTTNPYTESDTFAGESKSGTTKYMKISIYSDSKCKTVVKSANSKVVTWSSNSSSSSGTPTLTYGSYNTQSPVLGQNVYFSHTIKNGSGKYQIWYVYKNGSIISYGKCQRISSNPYYESDILAGESKDGTKKYMKVSLFSDSGCKKQVLTKSTPTITWKKSSSSSNGANVTVAFSGYNTKTPSKNQTVKFQHTVTNASGYRQKWFIVKNGTVTYQSSCDKINTNNYVESDSLSPESSSGTKKLLRVTIYSDSSCTKKVVSKDSASISWPASDSNPTPQPTPTPSGSCPSNTQSKTVGGTVYCVVLQKGDYNVIPKQVQDPSDARSNQCLGYAVAYGYKMKCNKTMTDFSTSNAEKHYDGPYPQSDSTYFPKIREYIKGNQPVDVRVQGSYGQHHILVFGFKKDSTNKGDQYLSYSDFLVVDPLERNTINWQSLISGSWRKKIDNDVRPIHCRS